MKLYNLIGTLVLAGLVAAIVWPAPVFLSNGVAHAFHHHAYIPPNRHLDGAPGEPYAADWVTLP
ncbi:MAG: hypothetical protein FIB04_00565 [Gammaproteobacteria bacterium]|nr:hypothetical protein [Gammaproteobacteria bacterium]